jgi:hypothetical protein
MTTGPITPDPANTETFNFAYQLTGSVSGGFTLEDPDPSSRKIVDPFAAQVTVKDPDGGTESEGQKIKVTDVGIDNTSTSMDKGNYTFIGAYDVKDHGSPLSGIVVEDKSGSFFFLTDSEYTGKIAGKNGDLTLTSYTDTICFLAGTLIRTPSGEVAVESLKRGDVVVTQDGRNVPVDWLGVQTVSLRFADKMRVLPIRIRAGALAENVPCRDLLVSPDHAILVDGALIHASALINGTSIIRESNVPATLMYYHVEVEDHSLVMAENTPAETFVDNVDRLNFDNWAEHEALYPNGKEVSELPYPRAKSHRQVPVRTRVMLAARSHAICANVTAADVA